MFALFFGILGSSIAVIAAAMQGSSSGVDVTPGRVWRGHVGLLWLTVKRNGSSWAWYLETVGSGAEPTAIDALRVAIRAGFESGKLTPADGVLLENGVIRNGTIYIGDDPSIDRITATVVREQDAAAKPYRWRVKVDSLNPAHVVDATDTSGTRGVAVLDMLVELQPYTE